MQAATGFAGWAAACLDGGWEIDGFAHPGLLGNSREECSILGKVLELCIDMASSKLSGFFKLR